MCGIGAGKRISAPIYRYIGDQIRRSHWILTSRVYQHSDERAFEVICQYLVNWNESEQALRWVQVPPPGAKRLTMTFNDFLPINVSIYDVLSGLSAAVDVVHDCLSTHYCQ